MVTTAAALHLHTATMQNMNDAHYFWHTWENRWLADININADRPVIKEMVSGEFWYGKVCELLSQMHVKTDMRWDQVRELRPFVQEALPYRAVDRTKLTNVREITHNGEVVDEFDDPIDIMANRVYNSMTSYQNSFNSVPDINFLSKRVPSMKETNTLII